MDEARAAAGGQEAAPAVAIGGGAAHDEVRGTVRSTPRGRIRTYAGIRYAAGVADGRTREPLRGGPAQAEPAAFPQRPGALDALLGPALGELPQRADAFQLTIQAPEDASGAPVIVFIPGGGFLSGSGMSRWYADSALVPATGAVLVTVNYRLGALGHALAAEGGGASAGLADPEQDPAADPSTAPLRDLVAALAWVREHIGSFGGDPGRLTLAGDSAGAWYAFALARLEETRGWFDRAILVSLPRIPPLAAARAAELRAELRRRIGPDAGEARESRGSGESGSSGASVASGGSGSSGEPGAAAIERVLDAQLALLMEHRAEGFVWRPAVSAVVPEDFADFRRSARELHVRDALLIRTPEESGGFLRARDPHDFTPESLDAYLRETFADPAAAAAHLRGLPRSGDPYVDRVRAQTLADFGLPTSEIADGLGPRGDAAVVRLDLRSGLDRASAPHCLTLPILFGNPEHWRDAPMLTGIPEAEAARASAALVGLIGAFIEGGSAGVRRSAGVLAEERPVDPGADPGVDPLVEPPAGPSAESPRDPDALPVLVVDGDGVRAEFEAGHGLRLRAPDAS